MICYLKCTWLFEAVCRLREIEASLGSRLLIFFESHNTIKLTFLFLSGPAI